MATRERTGFVNVDELQEQITVEDVLQFYGVDPGQVHRTQRELRMQCVLNCGKEQPTGDRALAIQVDGVKRWKCHQYDGGEACGQSGNLVGLCDLLKDGASCNGKPRGQRFKDIVQDLQAIAGGTPAAETTAAAPKREETPLPPAEPKVNVPLKDSDNERVRNLVHLDQNFVTDVAAMSPKASAYFRQRPYLTPAVCQKWRMGYLPSNAKGLLRGKIVYPLLSEKGDELCWFGRDPQYEDKHKKWEPSAGKADQEPRKFQFPKNFNRGLELFGQQASRLEEPGYRDAIAELGILVVEGPNDVIALDAIGVPSVGLCSNQITTEQVEKIAKWARLFADGTVTLMLDLDQAGQSGARQAAYELAQHSRVRLAWSSALFGGRFRGRQPESLSIEEWAEIHAALRRGGDSWNNR